MLYNIYCIEYNNNDIGEDIMKCIKCMSIIPDDSEFCHKCGAKQASLPSAAKGRAYNVSTWEELLEAWGKSYNDNIANAGFNLMNDIVVPKAGGVLICGILGDIEKRNIFSKNGSSIIGSILFTSYYHLKYEELKQEDRISYNQSRSKLCVNVDIICDEEHINPQIIVVGTLDVTFSGNIEGCLILNSGANTCIDNNINLDVLNIIINSWSKLTINGNISSESDENTIACYSTSELIVNGDISSVVASIESFEYSSVTINGNITNKSGEAFALKHSSLFLINGSISSQVGLSIRDNASAIISGNITAKIGVMIYNCEKAKLLIKGKLSCELVGFMDHRSFTPYKEGGIEILLEDHSDCGHCLYYARYMGRISPNAKKSIVFNPDIYPLKLTCLNGVVAKQGLIKQHIPSLTNCFEKAPDNLLIYNGHKDENDIISNFEDELWNNIENPMVVENEWELEYVWKKPGKEKHILLKTNLVLNEPLIAEEGCIYNFVKSLAHSIQHIKIHSTASNNNRPRVLIDTKSLGSLDKETELGRRGITLEAKGNVDIEITGDIYATDNAWGGNAIKATKGCNITIHGNVYTKYSRNVHEYFRNRTSLYVKSAALNLYGNVILIGEKHIHMNDCCAVFASSFSKIVIHGNICSANNGLVVEGASSDVTVIGNILADKTGVIYNGISNQTIAVSGSVIGKKYGIYARPTSDNIDNAEISVGENVYGEEYGYVYDLADDGNQIDRIRIYGTLSGGLADTSFSDLSCSENIIKVYKNTRFEEKASFSRRKEKNNVLF